MFQAIRVLNLLVGLLNIYLYSLGGGYHLLGIGMLNISVWAFTRGVHEWIVLWDILLGLIFLGANRYGVYITDECPQARYDCPEICDVDHIHLPIEECNNGKTEQESRSDSTTISFSRQLYKETVAADKPEGIWVCPWWAVSKWWEGFLRRTGNAYFYN